MVGCQSMSQSGDGVDWTPEAGERLEKLIASLGGATAAAKISGRSDEALSRYVRGGSRWDCWAVARLCWAGGRSLDWLVFGPTAVDAHRISERSVEDAAEFVIRAAREFPGLDPAEIARSIVRRARDLDESESGLTEEPTVGEQYTPR